MSNVATPKLRLAKILLVIGIIGGSAWLQFLLDNNLCISWQGNALRNMQQFGLVALHGVPVANAGGYEALTHPATNRGMSPICLYLVYYITRAFDWTGLGTMSFHILLAAVVFWGVWKLMDRDELAFAVAAAVVLSPGYGYWQKLLDMNAISVLAALPCMAIAVPVLSRPKQGPVAICGLFLLVLALASLNWTTAWVLGPCTLLLLGLPQINWRAVVLFIVLAAASCLPVVAISFLSQSGHAGGGTAAPGHAGIGEFVGRYFWGHIGYGEGLTTGRAWLRVAFANGIGLLPLILIWLALVVKYVRQSGAINWMAVSPVALAVVEVAGMRNYFGHHPWMASPVLLAGLVFSVVLLRAPRGETTACGRAFHLLLPAVPLFCFAYGMAVLMFLRANRVNEFSLITFVRQHTDRSALLVVPRNPDAKTAAMVARLQDVCDRHMEAVDDISHLPAKTGDVVILSSEPLTGPVELVARTTSQSTNSSSILSRAANWFNQTIAHRRSGDRLDLPDTFMLYKPK